MPLVTLCDGTGAARLLAVFSVSLIQRLYAVARFGAVMAALPLALFFYEHASADPGDRLGLDDGIGRITDVAMDGLSSTTSEVGTEPPTTTVEPNIIPSLTEALLTDQPTDFLVNTSAVTEPAIASAVQTAAPVVEIARPVLEPAEPEAAAVIAPLVDQAVLTAEPLIETATPLLTPVVEAVEPVIETAAPLLTPVVEAVEPVIETVAPLLTPIVEAVEPVISPVLEITEPITEPLANTISPVLPPQVSSDLGIQRLENRNPCAACDVTSPSRIGYPTTPTTRFLIGVADGGRFSRLDLESTGFATTTDPIVLTPGRLEDRSAPEASPSTGETASRAFVSLLDETSTTVTSDSSGGKQFAALAVIGLLGLSLWQSCRRCAAAWRYDRLSYAFHQPPR